MIRSLLAVVSLAVLTGCAVQRPISASCGPATAIPASATARSDGVDARCRAGVAQARQAILIGSTRETDSRSRTVGVPAGFLVALLVLMLLVGLA